MFPDRKKHARAFRSWVRFVQIKRKDFTADSVTAETSICEVHFKKEDYVASDLLQMEMGLRSRGQVRLEKSAVPSVYTGSEKATAPLRSQAASIKRRIFSRREDSSNTAHCSVPLCSASARCNSMLSFYSVPKDEELQGKWLQNIRREKDELTGHTRVCGRHFLPEDVEEPLHPQARRMLKKGAVPVLFEWNNYSVSPPRKEPADPPDCNGDGAMDVRAMDHDYCNLNGVSHTCVETQTPPNSVEEALKEKAKLIAQKTQLLKMIEEQALKNKFGLQRFAGSDEDIKHYTGFESYAHLMSFWSQIEPGAQDVVRFTRVKSGMQKEDIAEVAAIMLPQPIDEFFLFLSCLTAGLEPQYLAYTCDLSHDTMVRVILTWANFLYIVLGSVDIWLDEETVRRNMPEVFADYADTHVILETIDLRCQTLDSVLLETEAFRGYKQHTTVKGLAALAPHGPVMFVSHMYEGRLSDRELLKQCGLLSLLQPSMAVMVDKRFEIEDLLPGKVHMPLRPTEDHEWRPKKPGEVKKKKVVDDMVFRKYLFFVVGRLGKYELFKRIIPFSLTGCTTQLFAVACLLANYQDGHIVTQNRIDDWFDS